MAENAFKNFIDNLNTNPVLLASIAQLIVPVLVGFGVVQWTPEQTALVYGAITGISGMFVRGNTVSVNKVEQRVEEKVAHREMAGTTGTGSGMTPTPTPGPATRGLSILLAIALSASLAGCSKGAHVAAQVENVAHDGLMAFDRGLDSRCDAGQLTAETCKQLNTLLVPVWDIKNSLNRTILDNTSVLIPQRIADFRKAVGDLIALVNQLVEGGAKELLLRELNLALTQIQ